MKTLVIDCGNSRIKTALFDDDALLRLETVVNPATNDLSAVRSAIAQHLESAGSADRILCGISSVAAGLTQPILNLLTEDFRLSPLQITSHAMHGLKIHYSPPDSLGADRIADSAAAFHLFGAPCITVNFGTATTINLVLADGINTPIFAGGVICAGLQMTVSAFAATLPGLGGVGLAAPASVTAQNTKDAVSSGVLHGHAAMVDGLVAKIKRENSLTDCSVIATGGHAQLMKPLCANLTDIVPELTLLGISLIARRSGSGMAHC